MLFESLEPRGMRTVTVVEGYPGFYEVWGDDADNVIQISVAMDERTFALDGQTYTNVNFVSVWSLGGNDLVNVHTASGYATISAVLHGGVGNDQLLLNFDGAVWGDDDDDSILLSDAFRGEVHAGSGDDLAYMNGENIQAVVYGDGGHDVLNAGGNNHGIDIYGGPGNDYIHGSQHADLLDGGNGRDTIEGGGGNDTLDGGNGDDRFYASFPDEEQLYVIGGDGYDELYNYYGTMTVYGVEELYQLP
jgi:Ca2+-binding RTX toxin-like protein